jgi:hypothetical protein
MYWQRTYSVYLPIGPRAENVPNLHLAYPPVRIPRCPWASCHFIFEHDLSSLGQWDASDHGYHKPTTIAEDALRCGVELYLDDLPLFMDVRASECASAGSNGRTIGKGQVDALDNDSASVCAHIGRSTVACGKGDQGYI